MLRKTEARFAYPATEGALFADSYGAPASAGQRFLSCRDVRSQAANRVRAYSSRQIYLQECKRCIIRGEARTPQELASNARLSASGKERVALRATDSRRPLSPYSQGGMLSAAFAFTILAATGQREILLPSQSPISVAVVGVGVFGRNHARVYKELEQQGEPVRLIGVVDPDVNRADTVAREFGCKAFGSVLQLVTTHSEVQAASVAAPTVHHLSVARDLMKAGVDVLIEKPLATSLPEADQLVALAVTHKRIAQVGHLERFNPALRATLP